MSESVEGVARAFVRAINRQDVDALAELMTEEHRFVDSLGNVVEGRDRMRAGWKSYFAMVPDYTIAVEETFCDGPIVVLLGTAQGTYAGGAGAAAENRWQTPAAFRAQVEHGKVAEWRVYADNEPIRQVVARQGHQS
ncbi:MAG: nuclear transport factor 2 family protein [Terracidiphilus sp.]